MRNQCLDVWCISLPHLFNINTSIDRSILQVELGNMFSCCRSLVTLLQHVYWERYSTKQSDLHKNKTERPQINMVKKYSA